MFGRARLVLAAWYVGALVLTVASIGAVSYTLLRDDLENEIDESLRAAADRLLAVDTLAAGSGSVGAEATAVPTVDSRDGDDRSGKGGSGRSSSGSDDESDDHHSDDDDPRVELLSSDVFFIVFDETGTVVSNPRRVDLEGLDLAAQARSGDDPHDARGKEVHYRVLVEPLEGGTFLAVGRGLEVKDHQLRTLTTVFTAGGLIALAVALGSGFWLAGRTLRPIERSLESQRRFVSDASHELRTPLAIARANSSLLLENTEATIESRLDQAEAIASELDHLGVLVADLTTLARADEGRGNLLLERIDLAALAEEVVRDMGALADVRGIRLEARIAAAQVTGDRARLRQLLMILLDNALKYASPGGIATVTCATSHGHAELSVSDDGAGISEQDQKRIFERFYRSDSERTRAKGGTGLGLAIGKWIAEAHGGRITVESQPGRGTTFRVRVPAAK